MIIKGTSRAGPVGLTRHLTNVEKNERVELIETRGTVAEDLRGALIEMDAYAAGTRCQKPLYHAAISPEPPHQLTPDQRNEAVDELEAKLGLQNQPRVVMLHEKEGREHIHVVWSRIDLDHMRAIPDSHNYRKHEEAARELERRFGHERVQGAHHEREGVKRPDRTPSRSELRQEERTGITGKEVKRDVTELFRSNPDAPSFRDALADKGYAVARGDRRDYVLVDEAGGIHSLARRIDGVKAAELRQFMAPLDRASIPSIAEARETQARLYGNADGREVDLAKAYRRGEGYVSQTQAAIKEHRQRQRDLDSRHRDNRKTDDPLEQHQQRERARGGGDDEKRSETKPDDNGPSGDQDMSEAMQDRLDRLRAAKAEYSRGPPRDRQNEAPGGGHTRGR